LIGGGLAITIRESGMVAAKSETVPERELLLTRIIGRNERIVTTVETENGPRGRQIVKVWKERRAD
jgi:hypothetical protein